MSIQSEAARTPKLRFPEFSGEWEEKKLGDFFDITSSKRVFQDEWTSSGVPFYRAREIVKLYENGYVDNELFITEEMYEDYKTRYGAPVKDDLMVSGVGTLGKLYVVKDRDRFYFKDGNIVWFKTLKLISSKFVAHLFNTREVKKQISDNATVSTVGTFTIDSAKKTKVVIPPLPEQQKIASFLTSVDSKIEKLVKKQSLFGQYKKGLMQKIFSQEIRFKADDGSDYPDWEEKKLGDITDCLDNQRRPLNNAERNQMKGDIPYYGANSVVDYVNDYIFDDELVLLAEDGGNFDEFSSKPIAQKIVGKAWVNNHAHILKAKSIIITNFLFYSLVHKDIRRYIVGGGRSKLNRSDLLSIKTSLPSIPEQTKIANFLSSIDSKIEQIVKQLDESKQFKKALLQQMFI